MYCDINMYHILTALDFIHVEIGCVGGEFKILVLACQVSDICLRSFKQRQFYRELF